MGHALIFRSGELKVAWARHKVRSIRCSTSPLASTLFARFFLRALPTRRWHFWIGICWSAPSIILAWNPIRAISSLRPSRLDLEPC